MADEIGVSTKGVFDSKVVTFKHSGLVKDDVGKPVKVSAPDTVALCGDGDRMDGVLSSIVSDAECGVLVEGDVDVAYTGGDPNVGIAALVGDGAGALKVEASPTAYNYRRVLTRYAEDSTNYVRVVLP